MTMTDALSDAFISGVKGVVSDGNYTDSLYFVSPGRYIAASQRGGTYA
jgi:hypothetical protein